MARCSAPTAGSFRTHPLNGITWGASYERASGQARTREPCQLRILSARLLRMHLRTREQVMTGKIIIVTGASSGFGRLAANALAHAGHAVYASMRETAGRNAPQVADLEAYAKQHGVDLRALELDVNSEPSVDAGIAKVIAEHDRIDVIVHNAGHMVFGPAEAFTPEQLAQLYDINVLS